MNVPNLSAASKAFAPIETINGAIERSRRLGAATRLLVVGAVVAEVVLVALAAGGVVPRDWIGIVAVGGLTAVVTLLAVRRAWVREAREPFRYTFWVDPFEALGPGGGEQRPPAALERLAWLGTDLRELMSQRITRLSLLEDVHAQARSDQAGWGHVHVRGHYTFRRLSGGPTIEVRAFVRIGPQGSPETLAHPVDYTAAGPLRPTDYERIRDRVYFSVASAIYRQIRTDVEGKIRLLPAGRLRAAAYFYEALDYARSNTLDGYGEAQKLFESAAATYDPWWSGRPAGRFALASAAMTTTRGTVRRWAAKTISPRFARPDVMLAGAWVGSARMLLYRQVLAVLSGQTPNPAFEARPLAQAALDRLDSIPETTPLARETRFEALVTLANAWSRLAAPDRAQRTLAEARRLEPTRTHESGEFLLVSAAVEAHPIASLQLLRTSLETGTRATTQVAQFQLAIRNEYLWRARSTLERDVGRRVTDQYRAMLRRNPGVIAAWANLGYVLWLLGASGEANDVLRRGRDYKEVRRATYVSELDYGLARIAAEAGDFDGAYAHYIDAVSALLARGLTGAQWSYTDYYFDLISTPILDRFRRYRATVRARLREHARRPAEDRTEQRILDSVYAFVLNDYGDACWAYFLRTGDTTVRRQAEVAYESACKRNEDFVLPRWNLYRTQWWLGGDEHRAAAERHLDRVRELDPHWVDAVFAKADLLADAAWPKVSEARKNRELLDRLERRSASSEDLVAARQLVRPAAEPSAKGRGRDAFEAPVPVTTHGPTDTELAAELRVQIETDEREARERIDQAEQLIRRLLTHEWLADVWNAPDAKTQAARLLALLDRTDIRWPRDVTLLHVRALETWAKLLFSSSSDPHVVAAATALAQHLQRVYWPNDLLTWPGRADMAKRAVEFPGAYERIVATLDARWREAVANAQDDEELLADALVAQTDPETGTIRSFPVRAEAWQRACDLLEWRSVLWQYDEDRARLDWADWIAQGFKELELSRERYELFRGAVESGRDPIFLSALGDRLYALGGAEAELAPQSWEAAARAYERALVHPPRSGWRGVADSRRLDRAVVLWALAGRREQDAGGDGEPSPGRYAPALTELAALARRPGSVGRDWRRRFVGAAVPHVSSPRAYADLEEWLRDECRRREAAGDAEAARDAQRARLQLVRDCAPAWGPRADALAGLADEMSDASPLAVHGNAGLFPEGNDWWPTHPLFTEYIPAFRSEVEEELGVRVPGVRFRIDESLTWGSYALLVEESVVDRGWVPGSAASPACFCLDADACGALGLSGYEERNPVDGSTGLWLSGDELQVAERERLRLWDHFRFVIEHLGVVARARVAAFVGPDEVERLLRELEGPAARGDAEAILADDDALARLVRVLRALTREGVPIGRLPSIVSVFASRPGESDAGLVEAIRSTLLDELPGNDGHAALIGLSQSFEDEVATWRRPAGDREELAPPRNALPLLRETFRRELDGAAVALVVRRPGLRPLVRELVRLADSSVPVLAESEVRPPRALARTIRLPVGVAR